LLLHLCVCLFIQPLTLKPPPLPYTTLFRSESLPPTFGKAGAATRRRPCLQPLGSVPMEKNVTTSPMSTSASTSLLARHVYCVCLDRKSTRLNSSHVSTAYAVFCLKKQKTSV